MYLFHPPEEVIDEMIEDGDPEVCQYVGHEWGDAGGDLWVCLVCGVEKWAPPPQPLRIPNSRWRHG